nr:hypothetical protein [Tanacetum cinerariifolium]
MAFISSAKNSSGKEEVNTASFPTANTQVSPASADVATASFSHDTVCTYIDSQSNGSQGWKKNRKKITIQGIDVAGFDKLKGSKIEEQTPKVLMAIDRVGWDCSYIANEEENPALDSSCSQHMTGNKSYLLDYEPYNGGYVSFGQEGGKINGKGIIKNVDFVEASHIRYALTINPTVYVSHIRQFWFTVRIETTDEGTKILATVDGKSRTISVSFIRRNLKLKDEAGISSLPDAELFE